MDVRVTAVVELEPSSFASDSRVSPPVGSDAPAERAYWRASLADAAIDIEPVAGTWFVDNDDIVTHEHAARIISKRIDIAGAESLDEIGPLSGGLIFSRGPEALLAPQCCGDLTIRRELRDLLDAAPDAWTGIWVGHPSVCVRFQGDRIQFSQLVELRGEEELVPKFEMPIAQLHSRLTEIDAEVVTAAERLSSVLTGLTDLDHKAVACALLGESD